MALAAGIYFALLIAALFSWHRGVAKGRRPRQWLLQALFSFVVGIAWLLVDVAVVYLRHPPSALLMALTSSRLFFFTLVLCPGYTVIALSGWARSLVVHSVSGESVPRGR
jgi:hypothetical protein